jgi:excisionase family DNA binding protein
MSDEPLLFSQKEACRRLGICPKTLIKVLDKEGLSYRAVGKRRKFTQADLEAYIEGRRRVWGESGALSDSARAHGLVRGLRMSAAQPAVYPARAQSGDRGFGCSDRLEIRGLRCYVIFLI